MVLNRMRVLRNEVTPRSPVDAMGLVLPEMGKTKTSQDFLASRSNGNG